jgi:hypothetical protein
VSADTYPITDVIPNYIGQTTDTVIIVNVDPANTVYLSDTATTQKGFPLDPGSTLSWDAGRPLYAYLTDATKPASIVLTKNQGQYTSTKAIATALLQSGLASQIAADIQLKGAPPIDPLATIFTDVHPVAGGAAYNSAWINVGGYQSITFRIAEETGTVYASPLPRRVTLWWSDSSGGIPFAEEAFFISDTNGGAFGSLTAFTTYRTSVKDAWVQIQWEATARAATLKTWLTGSYKTLSRPEYTLQSGYDGVPAGWGEYGNGLDRLAAVYTSTQPFTNNQAYWVYPSVSAGAGYRSLVVAQTGSIPAGGTFDAFIYALAENPIYLYGKRAYAGPFPFEDDAPITFPFMPLGLLLRYNNGTPGSWAPAASLTLAYER